MTTTPHQLSTSNFVQTWANTSQINLADDWSGVPSIVGYRTGDVTTSTGVDAQTILTDTGFVVHVLANSTSTSTTGGVIEAETGTALGSNPTIGLQGSNANDYAAIVIYLDATNTQDVRFTANIRDIDVSADNAAQQVVVQYRIGSAGNWTNLVYHADVTTASTATQVTAIDVTLPDAADNQADVQIRILTTNAGGNDELIGVDDINVSSTPLGPVLPVLSIDNVTATEGDAGTTTYTFTVSLNAPAGPGGVTFDIATADGTAQDDDPATEDNDYVARVLTGQHIPAGSSTYTFDVTVNGDTAVEPNETFFVNVTNITGATAGDTQGQGTINNNDNPPTPGVSIGDAAIVEGASGVSYLVFTVTLSFSPTSPVTIDYATSNGTATAGSDYLAVSGQISFAAGDPVTKTISVPIVGDAVPEANETFTVTLSNLSGATPTDTSATGTITNDDGSAYFPLATANFEERWTDTTRISVNDNWSGVPYVVGYLGDYTTDSPTSVDPRTLTAASTLGNIDVIANRTNPAGENSGGVAEFELADPTIAIQGSGTADSPSIVLFMDASGRTDIRVQATLRDVDGGADDAAQAINVQYRTDPNGPWINAPGGYFADVTTAGSATQTTALDLVLPAAANNAPTLQIRIMTTNAGGNDEWVGIDDIVVSSLQSPPSYSIADAAAFEGTGAGTTPIVFTVTRAGDTSAPSTVNYAVTFPGGGFSADAFDFSGPTSGTVSFAVGESSKTFTLDIVADPNPEADEAFTVTLSAPSAGSVADGTATGTIVNDDGAPPFVTIADVVQAEGNAGTTIFTFTVTRTGGTGAFQVDYATTPTGTATESVDYVPTSGALVFATGDNSETFTVTVNGDTAGELAETFGVQLSNPTNFAVLADPNATGTIQNDDLLFIHQIQGSSYYSPILKSEGLSSFNTASTTTVIIQGVISAVDNEGDLQGFYITEESGHWDANSLTSEGIFVMTRDEDRNGIDLAAAMTLFGITDLAAGHLVTVSAKVMEYQYRDTLPRTMLVNPSAITVDSTGNAVPELVLDASRPIPNSILTLVTPDLTDSVGNTFDASRYALSFWETVEHMVVTIPDMVVADGFVDTAGGQPFFKAYSAVHADADQINSRGGYTIAGDPPNSPPDTADADDDTIAGGRHVHDGDINPDIIEVDFTGAAIDAPPSLTTQVTMGDALGDVTGIVEFDFANLKLMVTKYSGTEFVNAVPARETTALGNDGRALTVATFNVENLAPNTVNPSDTSRFDAIAEAIATNLNSPDIIMIEEIQDNNGTASGTTDASVTWGMLVAALNARVPGARYQWVDQPPTAANQDGGAGNGNIRVGFLYDTNRVQLGDLAWDAPIEDRRKYTDRIGDETRDAGDLIRYSDDMVAADIEPANWTNTRKSLLAQFTFSGNEIFLVANHFTAKSGSGDIWQAEQSIEAGQPANDSWDRRNEQAHDVYAMLNYIQTQGAGAGVISGGDYNDFYFYRPLEVVTGYVLPDGTARSGGARFDNLTLLLPEAERFSYTFDGRSQALDHIVSSQSLAAVATYDIVHINTGYNSRGTGADIDQSLSDHDPAVASFDFRTLNEILVGTPNRDVFRMEQGGNDHVSGLAGNDTFYFGAAFTSADFVDGGEGVDSLILDGDYSGGVTLGTGTTPNVVNVETISLVPASSTAFDGSAAGSHGYNITTVDGNVVAGGLLKVNGFYLRSGENLTFNGAAELDGRFIVLAGLGVDNLTGGSGNDVFVFGHDGRFGGTDIVNGGGGYDVVYLRGDYALDFKSPTAGTIVGVESIFLASTTDLQYSSGGDGEFDYSIVWNDAMLATGAIVTVNGSKLGAAETMTFDGSDEVGGRFRLFGGAADDTLTGGGGSDMIYGGLGADTLRGGATGDRFLYYSADESTPNGRDAIHDFTLGDLIDLSVIDADETMPGNQAFTFIGIEPFTGPGQLRAVGAGPIYTVQGNTDSDPDAEFELIVVLGDVHPLGAADFVL